MPYPEYSEWEEIQEQLLRGESVPMIEEDMPTFMRRPYVFSQRELEGADVAIVGVPYVQNDKGEYYGVDVKEWIAAPKRVRQQSAKYSSGYLPALDVDVFDHLEVVDYGDANIPPEVLEKTPPNVKEVLEAQYAVEEKVNQVLDADAIPIIIGQNSPASSYGVAKPILERTEGNVGVISLDTHWDTNKLDSLTRDSRVAGGNAWKAKMYEWHENVIKENHVEIGERGYGDYLGEKDWTKKTTFYPMWKVKEEGIESVCNDLDNAYQDTDAVYLHFDMDVLGGGGSAPGDLLGGLAEPMGMSDYEILKLSYEIGKRGFAGLSFLCIMPGSSVMYRTIVYIIMYMLAGKAVSES